MDYGAFPPDFNSARMYAGPGPESMLAAAAAWNGLAAELHSLASSYGSVISGLTASWLGPSSTAMETAATPYVAWLSATAGQAELTAIQAQSAAAAYQAAFAMTVPPSLIAENRAQQTMLVASNLLGQNTPAIAANEAQYSEMWAQDAAAMYGYAANSAVVTAAVKPLAPAPETTNLAGLAEQGAQNTGTSTGAGVQSTLSQVVSTVPQTLNNLSTSGSSTSSTSGLSGLLNSLLGGSSAATSTGTTTTSPFGDIGSGVLSSYATLPGWFGMMMGSNVLGPLIGTPMSNALTAAAAPVAAVDGAAAGAAAADGALGAAGGGLAGLGEAASVGGLSVPANWGWAATAPAGLLGSAPMLAPAAVPLAGADLGAGFGFPFMGLPGAAAVGAGAGAGAAAVKYGSRLRVMTRPPAAGYPAEPAASSVAKYPVPATFPTNGHAPPGYQPAIVYLPANGHESATADK